MSKSIYNFINKIHVACDTTVEERPALGFVYFRNGYAYATTQRILVRTPLSELILTNPDVEDVDVSLLNGYCVHARVLKKIMAHDEITILPEGVITATENNTTITYKLPLEGTDVANGPQFESVLAPPEERTPVKDIGLNARLLATLAEAMGVRDNIKLRFTTANRAIFIEPADPMNHSLGVIMPVYLEPALPGFEDEGEASEDFENNNEYQPTND